MTKVYFESRNFHSRLRWDQVKIAGQEVRYSVKYNVYGERPQPMTGCQNISELFCDLSSVMTNVRSKYNGKIMAGELCLGEFMHFVPFEETILEAPTLSVITAESSFTVSVTTPMGPQNRSIKEISCWERCQDSGKSSVNYIVSLTYPETDAGKVFTNTSGTITLSHLDQNTMYCGVVLYELTHPYIKQQSENTTFCVTLPVADKPWIPVFIGSALVAFFLLNILLLILCQQYVTRKRKLPKTLQIMSTYPIPDFNPDPKVKITTVKVFNESPWNTVESELALSRVPKNIQAVTNQGYTAQDDHDPDWHCHSYSNEHVAPVRAESCTSYSMVVGVKAPHDREELSSCANDSGLGDCISPGLSSCTDEDLFQVISHTELEDDPGMSESYSTSKILVLPVSRGDNGKLQFSSLAFQPMVSNIDHSSEIIPLVATSTPAGERALTDFISIDESNWTDNELRPKYRKAYLPNGVPQSCSELPSGETIFKVLLSDSNYRDNWVPGIQPDLLPEDTISIVDSQLHELAETEEDIDKLEASLLSGWMVQIQE
ncbi:Interleukin-20 receptor subunit alpha [Bagarius yarrelli]|uniref:Interleukin-20 receptor subunit alpha n=1 Tax=Bagarius yarrelli TaxID=175774 RepID=A0A556TLX1_BAGYA|nr:Interleukin-20 receptor subunit alpha [Bagarius yarrelli]